MKNILISVHVPIFLDINIFTSQYAHFSMDIQGQPSNRSKTKVWGRSGEGGGGGSEHVLDVPNGAEGEGLKYIALKHLVFT